MDDKMLDQDQPFSTLKKIAIQWGGKQIYKYIKEKNARKIPKKMFRKD